MDHIHSADPSGALAAGEFHPSSRTMTVSLKLKLKRRDREEKR